MVAELLLGLRGGAAAALLGLAEQLDRLLHGEGQRRAVGGDAAGVGAPLEVGAEAAVGGEQRQLVRLFGERRLADADRARQRERRQRLFQRDGLGLHALEERGHLGLLLLLELLALGHLGHLAELEVGAEAADLQVDLLAALGVVAELLGTLGALRDQLEGAGERELVRRRLVGHRRGLVAAREERPVAADAHLDQLALLVVAERDRADLARVDVVLHRADAVLQAGRAVAEVEVLEVVGALGLAVADVVEVALHLGGERVVDEPAEVLREQVDDGERGEGRHQRRALLPDVLAAHDRLDDRRVGGRAADAARLELLDQAGLGDATRRLRGVARRRELVGSGVPALLQARQHALGVGLGVLGVGFVEVLDVGQPVAGEVDGLAGGAEARLAVLLGLHGQRHRGALALGVLHLARDRAPPDQVVELALVVAHLRGEVVRVRERLAGGADRLVGLLRVCDVGRVAARLVRHVLAPELRFDQRARGGDGLRRQGRRVRAHVGDEAVLVEPLGGAHRALRGEAQLAGRLLLQRRGRERRLRPLGVGLLLDLDDLGLSASELLGQRPGDRLGQHGDVAAVLQLAGVRVEVAAVGDALAADRLQVGGERPRLLAALERRLQGPVVGGHEAHALALPLDDQPHRDRLHAAGRQLRLDLFPEQRGDRVAVETVDQAARLLGLDEVHVDLARRLQGLENGGLGDLVEHQSLGLALRLQLLEQVPRDRLPFAVFIGREVEGRRVLDHRPELLEVLLLLGGHHVERPELLLDVDAELGPLLSLELGGHLAGRARQVPDVADAGLDPVVRAQILADRARLGRRLDDHDGGALLLLAGHARWKSVVLLGGRGAACQASMARRSGCAAGMD